MKFFYLDRRTVDRVIWCLMMWVIEYNSEKWDLIELCPQLWIINVWWNFWRRLIEFIHFFLNNSEEDEMFLIWFVRRGLMCATCQCQILVFYSCKMSEFWIKFGNVREFYWKYYHNKQWPREVYIFEGVTLIIVIVLYYRCGKVWWW